MPDLYLTIPFVGCVYAHRDRRDFSRYTAEVLHGPPGKEFLLCCGSFRIYLTPMSSLNDECKNRLSAEDAAALDNEDHH